MIKVFEYILTYYGVCKEKIHMKIVKLSKRKLLEKEALVKATKLHTTLERTRNLLRTKKNILATSKILQIRSAMMGILGPRSYGGIIRLVRCRLQRYLANIYNSKFLCHIG